MKFRLYLAFLASVIFLLAAAPSHAQWARTATGTVASDTDPRTGSPLSVGTYSGVTAGQIALLYVSYRYGTAGSWTTPAGWTLLEDQGNAGTESALFCREVDAGLVSAGAVAVTGSVAGNALGVMVGYTGGTCTAHATVGQTNNTLSADVQTPALTITQNNTLVVYASMLNWLDANSGVTSYPNGATSFLAQGSAFGSNELSILLGDVAQTTAASLPSGTIDLVSTSTLRETSIIVSLRVAAPTFSGTVGAQSNVEDSPISPVNLSTFFSGVRESCAVTSGSLPTGLSLASSTCIVSGTPTTPATSSGIVITATGPGGTAVTNSFNWTITAAASAPTFTVQPTVTVRTENSFTLGYTPSASATFYAVACKIGTAAPSVAQVKLGQCTGGVTAEAAVNEAVTGADTTVLGGSLTFPRYNLYAVLNNGSGDSALSTIGTESLNPPAGKQDVTLTAVGASSWCAEYNTRYDPDIVAGDTVRIDLVTYPDSEAITQQADCNAYFSSDGSRQDFDTEFYDVSAGDWASGTTRFYVNNQFPFCVPPSYPQVLDVGAAMVTLDVTRYCVDAEDDALVATLTVGTLPAGLSFTDPNVTGTPSVENEAGVAVTWTVTDIVGDSDTQEIVFYPITTITVPDLSGLSEAAAIAQLDNIFLTSTVTRRCRRTATPATVVGQSPASGVEREPFDSIALTVAVRCGYMDGVIR